MLVELGQYFVQKDIDNTKKDTENTQNYTRKIDRQLLHLKKRHLNHRYNWMLWEIQNR